MDIKQVKHDFENGTLICRLTMGKVIDLALAASDKDEQIATLIACVEKHQKSVIDAHKKIAVLEEVSTSTNTHADDFDIDMFAAMLKAKMAACRERGRSGWNDPKVCSIDSLRKLLVHSVERGDPVDVGNFAMMLFARGAATSLNSELDHQINSMEAKRMHRPERRHAVVAVEVERREGYDRRARSAPAKG